MVNTAPPATIQPERYLLRGLLWCGPCREMMVPTRDSEGTRSYICLHWQCPCTVVTAEPVEERVWERYERLNELAARDVAPDARHAALLAVLRTVVVGTHPDDLSYVWRD